MTRHTPYDALPEYLTVDEFRAYMRLGRNTAYDLLRSGVLPHQRFGRTIRIPKVALRTDGARVPLRPTSGGQHPRDVSIAANGSGATGRSAGVRPSQRVVARSCRYCGASFEAVRHQTFCRPSCRWEHFKAKRARGEGPKADLFRVPFE